MDTRTSRGGFAADTQRAAAFLSRVRGESVPQDDCYAVLLAAMLVEARDEGRRQATVPPGTPSDGQRPRAVAEIEYQHRMGRYS